MTEILKWIITLGGDMNDENMPQIIEPDYKMLCQFLQGWVAGKGLSKDLTEDMAKMGLSLQPKWLISKDSNIKLEDLEQENK